MTVQSVNTYKQVRAAHGPWWNLEVSNWGNRETGADATSLVAPVVDPPDGGAAAIFIGPDSTVDQVIVQYTNPVPPGGVYLPPTPGQLSRPDLRRTCGIDKPFFDVPGPYFFGVAFSSMFTDTYFKDGVVAAQPFGLTNPAFEAPYLQIESYLTPPGLQAPPRRNPLWRVRSAQAVAATEVTVCILPVAGRRRITVNMKVDNTLVANPRVGAVVTNINTSLGLPSPVQFEDTISPAAVGALDATTGAQWSFTTQQQMQWIAVYATQTAGAGFIYAWVTATDD